MAEHTLGWRWIDWNYRDTDHFEGEGSLVDADGNEILRGTTTEGEDARVSIEGITPDEINRRGRLIAAAPDLLAVVKEVEHQLAMKQWRTHNEYGKEKVVEKLREQARAAIAKAENA